MKTVRIIFFSICCVVLLHITIVATQLCTTDGDVRLVGFNSKTIGSLEVCKNGVWGSVCASVGSNVAGGGTEWTRRNSIVVCRQLGSEDAVGITAKEGVHLNSNASFPHYGAMECSGVENELRDCYTTPPPPSGCEQTGEAFIVCRQPSTGDVRLVGSDGESEGIVEIFNSQPGYGWSTICDNGWSSEEASIVCKQLGYQTGKVKLYSSGSVLGWLPWKRYDNYSCTGSETSLPDCSYNGPDPYKCLSSYYAGVECFDEGISENSVEVLLKVIIIVILVLVLLLVVVTMALVILKCGLTRLRCKNQPSVNNGSSREVSSRSRQSPPSSDRRRGIARVSLDPTTWQELDPLFTNLAPPSYEDTVLADQNATLSQNSSSSSQATSSEDNDGDMRLELEEISNDSNSTGSERVLLLASGNGEMVSSFSDSDESIASSVEFNHTVVHLDSIATDSDSSGIQQQDECHGDNVEEDCRSTTGLFTS